MNTARIESAAKAISENKKALEWLLQYGTQLTGRDRDQASLSVHLNFASALAGAKEAEKILSSFASINLPEIVQTAIRNCRNTIELEREAIRRELDKDSSQ
ncbi:hypothetical protein PH562_16525 [Rhizobium sp. CNPSo 4062]|uniref:hypothetical protein n=1 Tax=Rhizobium sp. CNPSo 4062 TaxID=3021410 RepID=UPI002550AE7B|nr:hypothetical protein [Rhizobium sp. CNPSo 4062]MDK4703858.1 hypothetical protein [Rhizobium sp. CNPSo 4062]